jgi:hypothetical protein
VNPRRQLLSEQPGGAKDPGLDRADRHVECLGDVGVGLLFDQGQRGDGRKPWRQPAKGHPNRITQVVRVGNVHRVTPVVSRLRSYAASGGRTKLVQRRVRRNSPHPGAKAPRRVEPCPASIGAPEGFDQRILRGAGVASDADDPSVHLTLELPEQRLEGRFVALHEPLEQGGVHVIGHRVLLSLTAAAAAKVP